MKKAVSIMAIVLMGMGMVSCDNDSTAEDAALYEVNASDVDQQQVPERD
ncbi:MAG: hypothetical protein AAFX53_18165 [Bacteroidota bacterium]